MSILETSVKLSGPGSSWPVQSCIVGGLVRDVLMDVSPDNLGNPHITISLGPDLFKQFVDDGWVILDYTARHVDFPYEAVGQFRIHQHPLGPKFSASADGGPFSGMSINIVKATHKTGTGFARYMLASQVTSCDQVALDLSSHKIVMTAEWVDGYNNKTITNPDGEIDIYLKLKFAGWKFEENRTAAVRWSSPSSLSPVSIASGSVLTTAAPSVPVWATIDELNEEE